MAATDERWCVLRLKQILVVSALALWASSSSLIALDGSSGDPTPETVQSFLDGRNDAYRHVLSFAGLRFKDQSIPGMPTSNLYALYSQEERNSYISGAVFGFTHLASSFGRKDLVSCYNSVFPVAPETLDMIYTQRPEISGRNVVSILMNFCVSTKEIQAITSQIVSP
jgi:hypothetical protein